jgi:type IV pilus assembly protein PilE
MKQNQGFTLIELMITVVIVSILAAIAVPSYRQYAVRNAESLCQSELLKVSTEARNWRSQRLSYQGFSPRTAGDTFVASYCTPAANCSCQVSLYDGSDTTKDLQAGSGNSFVLKGVPVGNFVNQASTYLIDSKGQRCFKKASDTFTLTQVSGCPATNSANYRSW